MTSSLESQNTRASLATSRRYTCKSDFGKLRCGTRCWRHTIAHPKSNYRLCLLSTQMDCIANEFDLRVHLPRMWPRKRCKLTRAGWQKYTWILTCNVIVALVFWLSFLILFQLMQLIKSCQIFKVIIIDIFYNIFEEKNGTWNDK
jgi:hypothetical protein